MDVEMGTFAPLVFGTNGGMGLDRQNFLRTLANKLSTKNNRDFKIQRRGRQRERQKNNWFN